VHKNIILEVKGIKKIFGATKALKGVDLTVRSGEVHGLIGENGSGKSTLSSIIAGIQPQDSGEMIFKDKPYHPQNMIDALNKGIGMIVQESGTIGGITVAENIFLGEMKRFKKSGFVNKKQMYLEAESILREIGITDIKPNKTTQAIDYQDRKLIEVAKVMSRSPEVLIVDETTTALSQYGREIIYKIIKQYKEANKAVIFISHDLDELMEICNKLTILRDGELVQSLNKEEFDENTIKKLMVGRELTGSYYRDDYDTQISKDVVLRVENAYKKDELHNLSFNLHKGEILGIGGLSHCGMHTLGKCMFGFESLDGGKVVVDEKEIKNERQAMNCGIGYVSKDRDTEALSLYTSIKDNISVAALDKIKRAAGFILPGDEKKYVNKQIESLSIRCLSMEQYVYQLSGGNKQKVVFGKWIGRDSNILIMDCPTRGVDIGVKQAMYQLMSEMKREGKSMIIISEELTELIGMSDRIIIMKDGSISESFKRDEMLTEADIIGSMI